MESTAELEAPLIAGHEARGARPRSIGALLIGALLVGVALAVVTGGATYALARTAARPTDVIFVTPNAPMASPVPSHAATDAPSTGPVVPPMADQPGQEGLDDGLSVEAGQPSQDPNSVG